MSAERKVDKMEAILVRKRPYKNKRGGTKRSKDIDVLSTLSAKPNIAALEKEAEEFIDIIRVRRSAAGMLNKYADSSMIPTERETFEDTPVERHTSNREEQPTKAGRGVFPATLFRWMSNPKKDFEMSDEQIEEFISTARKERHAK